jgi:hypothetical protein
LEKRTVSCPLEPAHRADGVGNQRLIRVLHACSAGVFEDDGDIIAAGIAGGVGEAAG